MQRNETPAMKWVPYRSLPDPEGYTVSTTYGHYVTTLKLSGRSFATRDFEDLNLQHERLKRFLRQMASPNIALWTHMVHDHAPPFASTLRCAPGFPSHFARKYDQRIASQQLWSTDLYLSIVYRPDVTRAERAASAYIKRADAVANREVITQAVAHCAKKRREAIETLIDFDPEPLGPYSHNGHLFSSQLELYAFLLNGEWQRVPIHNGPIWLTTDRVSFGTETIEYRMATKRRLGALLGVDSYPAGNNDEDSEGGTGPHMFWPLLQARFPFVLTQSFSYLHDEKAKDLMKTQHNMLLQSGDSEILAEQLAVAIEHVKAGFSALGDYHFCFEVRGAPFAGEALREHVLALNENIEQARRLIGEAGIMVARENSDPWVGVLAKAFYGRLPGQFKGRQRLGQVLTPNFAAMFPLHNYPSGNATGNHWGDALMRLKTPAGTPVDFSLHARDPRDPESRKDVGHTLYVGRTGDGKTTFLATVMNQATKFEPTQVVLDLDRGLEANVLAMGGVYLALDAGVPTGWQPLQQEETPGNVEMMSRLLRALANRKERPLTLAQEKNLDEALEQTLRKPQHMRTFSFLNQFTDKRESAPGAGDSVFARLLPWCRGQKHGWVFDNPRDRVVPVLATSATVGMDITAFLASDTLADAAMMYLFHLLDSATDGRRFMGYFEECATSLDNPWVRERIKKALARWRKANAVFVGVTQTVESLRTSGISRMLIEQTPTQIFSGNPKADEEDYRRVLALSARELETVKTRLGPREILVKQNHLSAVVELDLRGFTAELHVLSGRREHRELIQRLRQEHGEDWLARFLIESVAPKQEFTHA